MSEIENLTAMDEDKAEELKRAKRKLVKMGISSAFGICGGIIFKKVLNVYAPIDTLNVNKAVYTIGGYGLYSAVVFAVSKAIGKDVDDWFEVYDTVAKSIKLYRKVKESSYTEAKETEDNGNDSNSGQ